MNECLICKKEFDSFENNNLFCIDHSEVKKKEFTFTWVKSDSGHTVGSVFHNQYERIIDAILNIQRCYVTTDMFNKVQPVTYSYSKVDDVDTITMKWGGEVVRIEWGDEQIIGRCPVCDSKDFKNADCLECLSHNHDLAKDMPKDKPILTLTWETLYERAKDNGIKITKTEIINLFEKFDDDSPALWEKFMEVVDINLENTNVRDEKEETE